VDVAHDQDISMEVLNRPTPYRDAALAGQLRWLVELRWLAIVGIAVAAALGKHLLLVLDNVRPIYVCAAWLLVCNLVYFLILAGSKPLSRIGALVFGLMQVVLDLVILTAVLYFSGGLSNPFTLFFVFHVIIAAIILPRWLSLGVCVSAVALYGILAMNEMGGGHWPGYRPLQGVAEDSQWHNRLYVHGAFLAFACTVFLVRYLTRIVIVRMTAKEAEAARNHDVLKAVIRGMHEGLIFLDRNHRIVLANPAARAWLPGDQGPDVTLDAYPEGLMGYVQGLNGQGNTPAAAIEFSTGHREPRTIEVRGSTVLGPDGHTLGHVVVGRDLTEHKKMAQDLVDQAEQVTAINEMLKLSRVKMAQREKMVAIGQMAAGIAHEIGNPLASLSSVVQYLERQATLPEAQGQLSVMHSHITRISHILKRMLNFTRPATSEFRWTDLNQLIENTLSLVQFDQRMQGVAVENLVNDQLPTVWLNPQSFEQVLLNIFLNAMDAMQAQPATAEHRLTISRTSDPESVEIRVQDTGIGMKQAVADRAFESFFTTKEIGKGTGLGLFISHNLVTELDGELRIESKPGVGTTVIIRIPVRPKAELFADRDARPIDSAKLETPTRETWHEGEVW
jgi:signal transduction histidine kinase